MVKKLGRRKKGKREEWRSKDIQSLDLNELSMATAVAKCLRRTASNVELFYEYAASGKGIQLGGRGALLDYNELVCILEEVKVIPKALPKEDCYDYFLAFLRKKMRSPSASTGQPASAGGRPSTKGSHRPKSSEGPEDELDFPAYQEFIEFLIERLGYLPYVEREKQIMEQHMESLKLRTTNLYDFSYRSNAIHRTERELKKAIGYNEEILFTNDPVELAQTKYTLPILPAYKIKTPRVVSELEGDKQIEPLANVSVPLDDLRHGEELRGLRLPAHRVARKSLHCTVRKYFDKWVSVVAGFDESLFENDDKARRLAGAANPDDGPSVEVKVDRSGQWIPFLPRAIPPIDHTLFPYSHPLSSEKH
ncbi:hypothetical protein GUITHDRAFT_101404 [Guillardia theta CCMP2712]|uniref:Uncharacterized protein n=1 Tax=Guillardia theta (strain CCMP2712) TaxID=905079 RepID=L1JX67_GUITC|nr:hypothetical protein GUITHDRAFT_101404 [Guillardia theta CCMP2712]EKX52952.1 hypothetical protein GUITHDRAFT_101404 [Guillardia theta CCMP2712]|eukprot:XP_005839932.1 hypothetical protein GUITHDRAFT_101404 [Guillardia theta CCMP2712]